MIYGYSWYDLHNMIISPGKMLSSNFTIERQAEQCLDDKGPTM